ncbi:MAG: hypothetical protein E7640_04090 [Ruminococcaceae bacterium]|nr:hypothetical protein [Oscillospiraceae bacterium]
MVESLIIGALSSLVISGFYFLFKKPTKKIHAYIQNAFLILLAIVCLLALIASFTTIDEHAISSLPALIVVIPGGYFIIRKLYKNIRQLNNNEFEE